MATFKLAVSNHLRADGTRNIRIRVIHNREAKYISTNHYVEDTAITKTRKIKDQDIVDAVEDTIREMRRAVGKLGYSSKSLSCAELCSHIERELLRKDFHLPFIAYGRKKIASKKASTAATYETTFAAILRYTGGRDPDITEITAKWLTGFVEFLEVEAGKKGGRATTHYPADIRHIFNLARADYNDEDIGSILISHNPFAKFRVGKPRASEHRNVSREIIQALIDLPSHSDPIAQGRGDHDVRNLARDCFLISFALMGINAADLWELQRPVDGVLTYERKKTRDRREDRAVMRILIPGEIEPILARHLAKGNYPSFQFPRTIQDVWRLPGGAECRPPKNMRGSGVAEVHVLLGKAFMGDAGGERGRHRQVDGSYRPQPRGPLDGCHGHLYRKRFPSALGCEQEGAGSVRLDVGHSFCARSLRRCSASYTSNERPLRHRLAGRRRMPAAKRMMPAV